MAELRTRFPYCRVVADAGPEGGIYGALNTALKSAADDHWSWFTYINDDDALGSRFSDALSQQLCARNPEPVVYGNVRLIDEGSSSFGWATTEPDPARLAHMLHQNISPLSQQGMLFSREAVQKLVQFDLRYELCADLDFWVRALQAGLPFRFFPHEVGKFRIRRGQLSSDVAKTRREFQDIVSRHLRRRPSPPVLWAAQVRYRFVNLPRYFERIRNRGFRTSEALLNDGR